MINFEKTDELFKDRLDFINLDKEARTLIQEMQPFWAKHLDPSVAKMVDKLVRQPDFHMFQDDASVAALKGQILAIWSFTISGAFDRQHAEAVHATGENFARIGLKPRWLLGPIGLIIDELFRATIEDQWPRLLRKSKMDGRGLAQSLSALMKAALIEVDASISIYLEIVDGERKKAEEARQRIERNQAAALQMVADALNRLSAGDLASGMSGDPAEEFKKLQFDFNKAVGELRETIGQVAGSSETIKNEVDEISHAADDLSRRTEQQVASLEETAAAIDQITATIQKSAQGMALARDISTLAKTNAEHGGHVVRNAINAMSEIEKSSQQIGQIIGVIDEIAFQTNLLALNAGVEAARAGDAGRGFAVVASEVRGLAQRSAEAAKEIKTLIALSGLHVGQGVDLVGESGKALDRIDAHVKELAQIIGEVTAGTQEQATALKEVNTTVNQMDEMTQQNAAMVEETTAACHGLAEKAEDLLRLVSRFETGERTVVTPLRRGPHKTQTAHGAHPAPGARSDANALRKPNSIVAQDSWEDF